MNNSPLPVPKSKSRLGFHYFPDSIHYREKDAEIWIPKLSELGASWLVCKSTCERAIPESFLRALLGAQIQPIIHFELPLASTISPTDLMTILSAYSRWGSHFALFFNRPNLQSSWTPSTWSQNDLVERFLDRYIPLANLALDNGLIPLFPTLEPGGSFWDTAFLQEALQALDRRNQTRILDNLILSSLGWTNHHNLNWGSGGHAKWNTSQPYFTPSDSQDQCGFRSYEWHQEIARKVIGKTCKTIIFQAGIPGDPPKCSTLTQNDPSITEINLALARLSMNEKPLDPTDKTSTLNPIPESVIACNLWLLAADDDSNFASQALFTSQQSQSPSVHTLLQWRQKANHKPITETKPSPSNWRFVIKHYILLPTLEGSPTDWHLDIVRPYLRKYSPTLGYSIQEAAYAARVTIVGGEEFFPDEMLSKLRSLGCQVERLEGSGTSIATLLAQR
jgi:hypothetical protein